jgi:hypothetical protein
LSADTRLSLQHVWIGNDSIERFHPSSSERVAPTLVSEKDNLCPT